MGAVKSWNATASGYSETPRIFASAAKFQSGTAKYSTSPCIQKDRGLAGHVDVSRHQWQRGEGNQSMQPESSSGGILGDQMTAEKAAPY